jgi:glycosyltransferase involved in cell wall biosynthesis
LLRDKPVRFVLVGKGPEKEALQRSARESKLNNVVFLPSVPKSSVPSLLTSFDALYIGLQRQPIYRFGISPNKLMDYMMSARPVLQAIEAGNDIVTESGCGITLNAEDPRALADATLRLMSWTPAQREEAGRRGRSYIVANHDYRALASRFLDVMSLEMRSGQKPDRKGIPCTANGL